MVSAVDVIGLPVWEYHQKVWIVELRSETHFCNVHRILRKTASFSWESAEKRQPWLGQDAYLYACVFMYVNSGLWDFLLLIHSRLFLVCVFLIIVYFLAFISFSCLLISRRPRIYWGILPFFPKITLELMTVVFCAVFWLLSVTCLLSFHTAIPWAVRCSWGMGRRYTSTTLLAIIALDFDQGLITPRPPNYPSLPLTFLHLPLLPCVK